MQKNTTDGKLSHHTLGVFKSGLWGIGQPKDTQQDPSHDNAPRIQVEGNKTEQTEKTTECLISADEDQHSPEDPTPSPTFSPIADQRILDGQAPPEARPQVSDVFIGIMGMTGVGKSTLISLVTDQEVVIGDDLDACMRQPRIIRDKLSVRS